MTISRRGVAAWVLVGALGMPPAIAATPVADATAAPSGAMPGDDALTCEQIYAQGMAESQKNQEARAQRNAERRAESTATMGLVAGALAVGGLGGTGVAANAAAHAQMDRQVADLSAPQPVNPRLDHLKRLFAQKHCVVPK